MRTVFKHPVTLAAAAVCGVIAAVSGVMAATEAVYKYTTPRTSFYAIDAEAMSPIESLSVGNFQSGSGGLTSTGGTSCHQTGVNLPHGATVTAVAVVYQSAGAHHFGVTLLRRSNVGTDVYAMAHKAFLDESGVKKQAGIPVVANLAVIDNQHYTYGLGLCVDTDSVFYGARITYTSNNAGD